MIKKLLALNWRLVLSRLIVVVLIGGLAYYALEPWLPWNQASRPRTVVVYGFSILGDVMNLGIFPAFKQEWKTHTGEEIEFISSFAGSGTVTNQIILGVPAEVGILSTELDAQRLLAQKVVRGPTWRDLPHQGTVNVTPFIIMTRPGNPKQIHDFSDLTRPGVGVVHPDPRTSGGAQWAILAEYGSALQAGENEQEATRQLQGIWNNVVAQAASARAARTQFDNGFGDALITYEQEPLYDRSRGKLKADVIYPRSTILSEHTVVVIDRNIPASDRALVDAFTQYLWSDEAQRIFVKYGFRSINDELNRGNADFAVIQSPFTVASLGGWTHAKSDIIERIWKSQVIEALNR